jgi:hypothetical protein
VVVGRHGGGGATVDQLGAHDFNRPPMKIVHSCIIKIIRGNKTMAVVT